MCVLPGIGAFKYSDEAADVAKATGKGTKKDFGEKIAKAVDMKNAGKASSTVDEAIHAADDIVDKTDEVAEAVTDSAIKNGDKVANGAGVVDDVVEGGIEVIDSTVLTHSSVGDFTYDPKTGVVSKMKGVGHGQVNIELLNAKGIEYNIVHVYDNGVGIGVIRTNGKIGTIFLDATMRP